MNSNFLRSGHDVVGPIHHVKRRSTVREQDYFHRSTVNNLESAYVLRRVELNHREGHSPWSIRQTAIYHRFEINLDTCDAASKSLQPPDSMFLLIAPPEKLEPELIKCLQPSAHGNQAISTWNAHRLLIADGLKNWMEYMSYLEEQLKEQVRSKLFWLIIEHSI